MFDIKLIKIMVINNAYHIDFPTVKQLIHKLSSATVKDRLRNGLEDVKTKSNDLYNTNNYLLTLRQILNITRSQVDEELDTITLDRFSNKDNSGRQEVQIDRNQFKNPPRNGGCGYNLNHKRNRYQRRSQSFDDDKIIPYVNESRDHVYNRNGKKRKVNHHN